MPAKTRIGESFLRVIGFTAGHWRRHPALAGGIIALMLGFTVADLLLPIYAGRLVDAISLPDRAAGREIAISAVTSMAFIGLAMVGLRHFAFLGIVRLTLAMMRDMAQEAFWRVQRFATDWHANTFSGSTVRRITRGMWAVDLLNDTIIQALIPSVAVLVGATVLLGLRWPIMGLVIGASAIIFLGMATAFTLFYVAPAARLSNRWDTRVGAVLADTVPVRSTLIKRLAPLGQLTYSVYMLHALI